MALTTEEIHSLLAARDAVDELIARHIADLERPPEHDEILGSREVAAMLGIHIDTLRRWRKECPEQLPPEASVSGFQARWRRGDVVDFLRRRSRSAASA